MADIYFNITGNGTAYTTPTSPTIGQTFTFYAIPDVGESFLDVTCTNDQGVYVAVPQSDTFTLVMPNTQYLTFNVEFTGTTPPIPPTPTRRRRKQMPIWMYPCLKNR